MDTAKDIEATIISMADERQAAILRRFFKTGPGEYGEGDRFLGVKNPQVRSVVKEAWRNTTLDEAVKLVRNPWHEVRLCGLLIMVAMFEKAAKGYKPNKPNENNEANKANEATMKEIFETYLSLHPFINNWDLVDLSVYKIAGCYELMHPEITILDEWIKPEYTLWQRRISMVSTWIHIRHNKFDKAFARAEVLQKSDHDLLHKAAGWMLREIYKHNGREELEDFLETHVQQMPSIMLCYTTELMPPQEREYWRKRRKGEIGLITAFENIPEKSQKQIKEKNMSEQPIERHPLEPFLPTNCRVLFLGSFPPQRKRWCMDFFYPNWINDHWRIEGLVWFGDKNRFVDEERKTFRLPEIKTFLNEKGIGFYDTATAVRRLADNASDKFLEIVEPTDINALITPLKELKAIAVAGEKACETICTYYNIKEQPKTGTFVEIPSSLIRLYRLPSSSRAYPLALEKKAETYRRMFEELEML